MAKATVNIVEAARSERQHEETARADLLAALAANPDGIADLLKLLQALADKGVLELLMAMVNQGSEVLGILASLANRPENSGGIKSGIALAQGLAKFDAAQVHQFFDALAGGMAAIKVQDEPGRSLGMFELIRTIRDPDVNRAIQTGVMFLKGVGQSMRPARSGDGV